MNQIRHYDGPEYWVETPGPPIEIIQRKSNDEEKGRWIPVSEQLPELGERVLVYCGQYNTEKHVRHIAYRKKTAEGLLWVHYYGWHSLEDVTHWQPLPEPPIERTGDEQHS